MVTTVRQASLTVTFAGNVLTDVLSARGQVAADSGWPTCSVFVTAKPVVGNEEADLDVVAGAGNNVTRFTGKLRRFRSSGFPKALEMVCTGTLAYSAEWAPDTDLVYDTSTSTYVELEEGLTPEGYFGIDDATLVATALLIVPGVTFTLADISGTGLTLGEDAPDAFVWHAGTTAWSYIQQLDRATLYRTYQAQDGTIRRIQMIGHPNSTPDFTFTDVDVLDGSTGDRSTEQTRNAVRVFGYDYGDGAVRGLAAGAFGDLDGTGPDQWRLSEFSSNLIENGLDDEGLPVDAGGLDAQTIADAILGDTLKEFVEATVYSWRDDTHGPGLTCQLDCLNRLAIGEPMWVQGYGWEISENGWQSTYTLSGGGLEQTYPTPEV